MYKIELTKEAEEDFSKLDNESQIRISKKIKELSSNPNLGKPLRAHLAGLRSVRAGKYRVIYQVRKSFLLIYIIKIGHRKNVYA